MRRLQVCVALLMVASCRSAAPTPPATTTAPPAATTPVTVTEPTTTPATTTTTTTIAVTTTTILGRPDWLGTRPLPLLDDGTAAVLPTPAELQVRIIGTVDTLDPPEDDVFRSTITPVPEDVAARSTWHEGCPVSLDELRYLTMSFWGFDGRPHTGEMIVNAAHAESVVSVFEQMHAARYPIEEMRVVSRADLEAAPTGDGNNTTSFVCRNVVFSDTWSRHAFGLAIDVNPFHNPYRSGERVLPELASAYLDRDDVRPGMVIAGDAVTTAFDAAGWEWGGGWRSLVDYMHFSVDGT